MNDVNNPFSLIRVKWILVFIAVFSSLAGFSQVSINNDGTAPHASAMLEVKSTTRGFLLPRMNFASRPVSPATGLVIYQLDAGPGIYHYDGTAWQKMSLAAYDFWNPNGADIYFNTGRVGVGTSNPDNNGLYSTNYINGRGAVLGTDESTGYVYAAGYLGVLLPSLLGVPIPVTNVGVLGIKPDNGWEGAAIYGWNNSSYPGNNYGGLFVADGAGTQTVNYGVYSVTKNANQAIAGYFQGRVQVEGNSKTSLAADSLYTVFSSHVNHSYYNDTYAISGVSTPQPGWGYGVYGEGGYRGVEGNANAQNYSGYAYGVYGQATGSNTGVRIGVYGYASGGITNWGSYFLGSNYMSGDLRIGTTTAATGYALSVNGKIACTEVLVQDPGAWPDYVFTSDYKLRSLDNLEQNIKENGHLPGLPSAQEIETNGLHIGDMQKQVVEKVEELTLYTIEQGKMLQELKKEIDALKAENTSLKKAINSK